MTTMRPSGFQAIHALRQNLRDLFEFLVEINPYSLKGSRRRIFPGLTRAHSLGDNFAELPRGDDGLFLARRNKRSCNLFSKPFFAVVTYYLP